MLHYHRYGKSLINLKGFMRTSPIPWLCVLRQQSLSLLANNYSTTAGASEKQYFRMKYLVNNCGFSSETALELSKHVSFRKSETPDVVLRLFRSLNISDSQMRDTIEKAPWLLSKRPVKTISPTLEFFKSKGASNSQLAVIVTSNPWSFRNGLVNCIIPRYDFIKSFLQSDERTITSILRNPRIITDQWLARKVEVLQDYGVTHSGIAVLLRHWPRTINFNIDVLKMKVDEVKELGLHPSTISFVAALRAKVTVSKLSWEQKVELFGRWGWSDEALRKAFVKCPFCMLTSGSKIEAVMTFFLNHMGWSSLRLAECPKLLTLSLKKRIIPRGSVLQFLQSSGLIKYVGWSYFMISEKMFLQKFVNCFQAEAPQLLKLYGEKLSLPG